MLIAQKLDTYVIRNVCYKENCTVPIIEESANLKIAKGLVNRGKTVIIEDSGVGVKAATSAGARVFGLTAGKHWHLNRDKNELFDNGAMNVFSDYKSLGKAIEDL